MSRFLIGFAAILLMLFAFQNCGGGFQSTALYQLDAQSQTSLKAISLPEDKEITISACMNYDNKNSNITWCGSYEMMAHLSLYRATHDLQHLLDFIVYSQKVIGKRDDQIGFGNRKKTWSQTNYTDGVPYPSLVGDGMITYPLADFAAIILRDEPSLGDVMVKSATMQTTLKDLAVQYLADVQQNITYHDPEWDPNVGGYRALPETADYFKDSHGRSASGFAELPFNMSMAMGRTLVTVYRLTGDQNIRAKIDKMISRWKAYRTISNGFVSWPYWSAFPETAEDISHGAIDIDFFRLVYEHRIGGVTRADLEALAHTFSARMYYSVEGQISYLVSGDVRNTPKETFTTYADTMLWLPLSSYDEELKRIAIDASRLARPPIEGYTQWVFAMMREFGGRKSLGESCRLDSECFSNRCDSISLACTQR